MGEVKVEGRLCFGEERLGLFRLILVGLIDSYVVLYSHQ